MFIKLIIGYSNTFQKNVNPKYWKKYIKKKKTIKYRPDTVMIMIYNLDLYPVLPRKVQDGFTIILLLILRLSILKLYCSMNVTFLAIYYE